MQGLFRSHVYKLRRRLVARELLIAFNRDDRAVPGFTRSRCQKNVTSKQIVLTPANLSSPDSQLYRALKERTTVKDRQRLSLGGPDEDYYMESVALRNVGEGAVLSMVILAPHPEFIATARGLYYHR